MNKKEAATFLFTIAKEIKRSFESPVILVTRKDYGEDIFNSLIEMRTALLQQAAPARVADIINNFHVGWLQAVQDIEKNKKRVKDTPRDIFLKAIEFTRECMNNRHKNFQKFIDQLQLNMTTEEITLIQTDLAIIGDLRDIVNATLIEKLKYLRNLADSTEFCSKINDEIEELLNWLDRLNDHLAIQFCKVLNLRVPQFSSDLTKTLQDIVDEVAESTDPKSQKLASEIMSKGKILGSIVRIDSVNDLEIRKVIEKIKILENRIDRLKNENSSALMALQHKTLYLEERLQSLENLKESLNNLRNQNRRTYGDLTLSQSNEYQIFNHILPHNERCRLVEQLVKLWDAAIAPGCDRKSIISILSAADIKEVFSDDIGHFTVDKYGRKLYTQSNDTKLYQLNEKNELVPMRDDDKHVFFYDECGRYYINDLRQRIYKADGSASEYVLQKAGVLVKVREEIDGNEYFYDELGRYYFNGFGKRIYHEENSDTEYEHDGLGNLVKIRDELPFYNTCPREPMVMEEMKYLKHAIGVALKKCLAEVVLHQPPDPVLYLAECLEKYRTNVETKQRRSVEEKEMRAERALQPLPTIISPERSYVGIGEGEEFDSDYNYTSYESMKF
ncbi:hypothetical protein O3G_MSEX002451 [Manduca sexta]|nr:hypothetical protein O3G_MSEX002451 [Manduca sexta]